MWGPHPHWYGPDPQGPHSCINAGQKAGHGRLQGEGTKLKTHYQVAGKRHSYRVTSVLRGGIAVGRWVGGLRFSAGMICADDLDGFLAYVEGLSLTMEPYLRPQP